MQSINGYIFKLNPDEVIDYCKYKKIDLNKPINITETYFKGEYISIIFACKESTKNELLLKVFIENGANVNITDTNKYKSFFSDILHPGYIDLLRISLPYFNLRKNRKLMWEVYYWLRRPGEYREDFREILEELISKFNQKTWKRNLRRFTTEKHYTATTSSDFFDSYPMLY